MIILLKVLQVQLSILLIKAQDFNLLLGSQTATNQIQGGIIAGMVEAYAISDDTLKEVDALATLLSERFNEVNQSD